MNSNAIDHQQAIKNMMAERYLLGELSENERDAYEAHLFDCQICFAQVKAGTEFVSYLKKTGVEDPVIVPQPRWRQPLGHWFQFKPAFVLALLLLFTGSFNIYQARLLHQANAPEIVNVHTLHPDARGDDNAIIVSRRGAFELRVVFQSPGGYKLSRVQVVNADGKEVASTLINKVQGNELQIRLDVDKFQTGNYKLLLEAVEPPATVETTIKEYPFELTLQD